jgi:hypothetical protein
VGRRHDLQQSRHDAGTVVWLEEKSVHSQTKGVIVIPSYGCAPSIIFMIGLAGSDGVQGVKAMAWGF